MKKEVIRLEDIKKSYRMGKDITVEALRGVNLVVNQGDFMSILGPSGSGKSTLLHMVGLLDTPTSGKRYVDGIDTSTMGEDEQARIRGLKIGFIFQTFNLIPSLTALENVELPLMLCRGSCPDRREKAADLLKRVGLGDRLNHHPNELSGGQRQRVAIARALVNDPELVLADEPTGNLDTKTGEGILDLLKGLNDQGKTVVMITHNPYLTEVTKRIMHLKDGMITEKTKVSR
ncbi:MAG: ABC transporter ATP-binding protein [Candidatus Micrarchaeota archaeon]